MNGAVITALNEAGTIGELVYQLKRQGLSVCVVDDGSTDDTGQIANLCGAHVIKHKTPQGIGKSLVEAWRYAILQGWQYTLQIDAGGSHDPKDFQYVSHYADVLIGTRFTVDLDYQGGTWWRKAGSKAVAWFCNFVTHQHINDWTSGYRLFSLNALRRLVEVHYMTNMHTWQIEVLQAAIDNEMTIAEAPITYRATNSTMKLQTVDDLFKVLLWMLFQ